MNGTEPRWNPESERGVSRPTESDLRHYLEVAETIVRESRSLVLSFDHRRLSTRAKPDGSPVTDADVAVEDFIRSRLGAAFPRHGIVGEERTATAPEAAFRWIIDPIDGTRSFVRGIPLYGTLLSLRHEGRSVVGVIGLPAMDLIYAGAAGLGAYCNGKRVELSEVEPGSPPEREIIAVGERRQFAARGRAGVFDRIMRSGHSVRTYCDCFGHALAIDGRVGAMVDFGVCIWDMAATEILVHEAGGSFVRLSGEDRVTRDDSRHDVVFGKPQVVDRILAVIGGDAGLRR